MRGPFFELKNVVRQSSISQRWKKRKPTNLNDQADDHASDDGPL
jgi:hypothetical protein